MTSPTPLQNKTVLVPRERKQAKFFSQMVVKYGGIPIEIPLLAFRPREVSTEIESTIQHLNQYDWIIFTSQVTVETFFPYRDLLLSSGAPKTAAIGEKTAQALREKGVHVAFVPSEFVAESFVTDFASFIHKGDRILIPKGNLARDYISNGLTEIGAIVDEIIMYETYFPEESKGKLAALLSMRKLDIIPFTSPSTVDHFMEVVKENELFSELESCIFACIGPVAKARAEYFRLPVHAVPEIFTVEEMMKGIVQFVNDHFPVNYYPC
jgi:uroporphyrinogen-III synthase